MKPHFNSKPEYLSNYITHKSVDEGALEREKKERKVDEKDKLEMERLETLIRN